MSNIFQTASGIVGNVGNQLQYATTRVGNQLQVTTDRVIPPKQREELLRKLRVFANRNPKLTAFLAAQITLTGIPIVLFLAFATTTLLISLLTCLLLGLLASLAFTFFVVGFTLLFVIPTVLVASCSATFIFIWGLAGYLILRRFNDGEAPTKRGTLVGNKLHGLSGGRLELLNGDGSSDGHDERAGEVARTSAEKGQSGYDRNQERQAVSYEGSGERLSGSNGVNGSDEWESKWTHEVQRQPVVLETGNAYEVLKVDAPIS